MSPVRHPDQSKSVELVNTAHISGELGEVEIDEYKITMSLKCRANGETYSVLYHPSQWNAIEIPLPAGALVTVGGWLVEDRQYEGAGVSIRGWSPEKHLTQATENELAQLPTGKLIGTVLRILPKNLIELSVISQSRDKEYKNNFTLGLTKQARRTFASRVSVGLKIRTQLVLAGEKRYPWDGTPRITKFGIVRELP